MRQLPSQRCRYRLLSVLPAFPSGNLCPYRHDISQRLQTVLFQRRYIFRTRIKKFFRHIRIHICPDSAVLAEVKRFETLFQDFKNLLLRIFFFKSFQDTAKRFDFLEFSPDFSAISLVSASIPQEPPAGSIGRSMPNSSCSMMCTFLAIRRENSSPLRTVAS